MRTAMAAAVQSVFDAGISLRERLEAGEPLEWDRERAFLKAQLAVLQTDAVDREVPGPDEIAFDFSMPDNPAERRRLTRKTIRFALTCWLDDFLGYYSAWGPRWRQEPLENELYDLPPAGSKFWDEARYAGTRGDIDALEVMYWCALLGYRGDWRAEPERVAAWAARVRTMLQRNTQPWTMPASLAPSPQDTLTPSILPYRSMIFSLLMGVALISPPALLLLWRFSP